MAVITYQYTGAMVSYTVPAGVEAVNIECWGGKGGASRNGGGYGGYASGSRLVATGDVLYIWVGGGATSVNGAFPGGGHAGAVHGGGGGGFSVVRLNGTATGNTLIAAGGGGGSGYGSGGTVPTGGGSGGGTNGVAGFGGAGAGYGAGADQTNGFAQGQGGYSTSYGGGGGGGWYGGWGGGNGGGGGGSGYLHSSMFSTSFRTGISAGFGLVVITTYSVAPVPTGVLPGSGTTVIIPNPFLIANVVACNTGQAQKIEWSFCLSSSFASGVKIVTDSVFRVSGVSTFVPTIAQLKLSSGTWWSRARAIDSFGVAGAYSTATSFSVLHSPSTLNQNPTANKGVAYSPTVVFSWDFSDPWSGDTQTAYEILVDNNSDGTSLIDTGKVVSTAHTAAIDVGSYANQVLRWCIKVWDTDDTPSTYSNYRLFVEVDPPVVAITEPSAGGVVDTGSPTVTWTNDIYTIQESYQVGFYTADGVTIVFLSPFIKGLDLTYTPSAVVLSNSNTYVVKVTVLDTDGFSSFDSRTFTTTYESPDAVVYTTENFYATLGYVNVDWSQTAADGAFYCWRVYRTVFGTYDLECIFESFDVNRVNYHDWSAPTGQIYSYTVVQQAWRSGILLESDSNQSAPALQLDSSNYWLTNPNDETKNFLLYSVTADSYTNEIEQEAFIVIDRGRKVNYGTSIGKGGTLVAQLRDKADITARLQRINFEAMQEAKVTYLLRDPFGNILQVSMGNVQINRIAGVGAVEFCNVSIPYSEVF